LDAAHDREALETVGLDVDSLPRGARTPLRRGGEPLGRSDRARLALARAMYGTPPLLLIDGLEGDLDDDGRRMLDRVLSRYPGVVVMAGSEQLAQLLGAREHRLHPLQAGAMPEAERVGGRPDGEDDD